MKIATACAVLSVLVVSRRWAFIGEGISHSGFGGAGTAWLLALVVPSLNQPWLPYVCVIVFCLLTAWAMREIEMVDVFEARIASLSRYGCSSR